MAFRLGILETHPIQYKIPWFRMLHAHPEIDLTVFYCMIPDAKQQGEGFGVEFEWDFPLLEGYRYEVLDNVSRNPGMCHFKGCDTPEIMDWVSGKRQVASESSQVSGFIPHPSFDAVIINGWVVKSCLQGLWACKRAGVPALLRCEANDLRPRAWWKTVVHKFLLRQFIAFIAIGKSNRDFYVNRGVDTEKIVNGFYCVESERFAKRSEEARGKRPDLRKKWNIPEKAICFVFSGKFEEKKRPMDILHALREVVQGSKFKGQASQVGDFTNQKPVTSNQQVHSVHVLMVGDGELKKECETYACERTLPVTFTGFLNQTELPEAYAASDCLVLPSGYGETWGLVVNEAMACGLPAIVSDRVGSSKDLIHKGQTGEVFEFGHVDALANCMIRLAQDPDKSRQMGFEAKKAIKEYSIDNLTKATLNALQLI